MAHLWRRAERVASISGETERRAGVRVPSTSKRQRVVGRGRAEKGGMIAEAGVGVVIVGFRWVGGSEGFGKLRGIGSRFG